MAHDCVNGWIVASEADPPPWNPGDPTGVQPDYPMMHKESYRPCDICLPKVYEKWLTGKFQRGRKAEPPVREPPLDYQDEVLF